MTVLGKILVILHFIISLVAAALFVMVYAVHTNWSNGYKDLESQVKVASASATASAKEAEESRRAGDERVRQEQEKTNAKANEVELQKREVEATRTDLAKVQANLAEATRAIEANAAQKKAQAEEVRRLELTVLAKDDLIKRQAETMNDLRKDKVNADIQASAFKEMSEGLEKRVRELEETVKRTKQSGVVPAGGTFPAAADNPPPEDVQGVVKNADASGLVLISVGSDAGVLKGNTLEVYRLGATPKYLGKIRIIEVRAYEAVGQTIGKPNGPILKDDRVASKIVK